MKSAIAALILPLCLTACVGADSKATRALTAPDVVAYSRAQQTQAAAELERCACPVLEEMMRDYCVMRDQSRALAGKNPTCTAGQKAGK